MSKLLKLAEEYEETLRSGDPRLTPSTEKIPEIGVEEMKSNGWEIECLKLAVKFDEMAAYADSSSKLLKSFDSMEIYGRDGIKHRVEWMKKLLREAWDMFGDLP